MHEELKWLDGSHWVQFHDREVRQAYLPRVGGNIMTGVEQIKLNRIHVNGNFEIWHKPGRLHQMVLYERAYEPACLLLMKNTNEEQDGWLHYETIDIVITGRKQHAVRLRCIKRIDNMV